MCACVRECDDQHDVCVDPCSHVTQAGANVDAGDTADSTPLHLAISFKQTEVMAALLEAGADTSLPDALKGTPLEHVCACVCGCGCVGGGVTCLCLGKGGGQGLVHTRSVCKDLRTRVCASHLRSWVRVRTPTGAVPGEPGGGGAAEIRQYEHTQ